MRYFLLVSELMAVATKKPRCLAIKIVLTSAAISPTIVIALKQAEKPKMLANVT